MPMKPNISFKKKELKINPYYSKAWLRSISIGSFCELVLAGAVLNVVIMYS